MQMAQSAARGRRAMPAMSLPGRSCEPTFQPQVHSSQNVITLFVSMPPWVAGAQQTGSAVDPRGVKLPQIQVNATTPVAPPTRTAPARPSGRPVAAPAAPAPAGTTVAKPIPGAVEQDKIPSNVQTANAPDFSYTVPPALFQSMVRALPGVSLGSQTGNEFRADFNYRGFTASPVICTPQGVAVYQN